MTTPTPHYNHQKRTLGVSLKMYFTPSQTLPYIASILPLGPLALTLNIDLFIIPDFLSLQATSTTLRLLQEPPSPSPSHSPSPIRLGAQNCFWEDSGAFTGEVSPAVLKSIGCSIVELGHAERRRLFGEDDASVARKARAAERNGLVPLVCVGERHEGEVQEVVRECTPQIESVLEVTREEVIFAYEPVWAIGQVAPAKPEYINAVVRELRGVCGERKVRFLYGGSAGPGTFEKIKESVDGLFLGRFGHDPERLAQVVREIGA